MELSGTTQTKSRRNSNIGSENFEANQQNRDEPRSDQTSSSTMAGSFLPSSDTSTATDVAMTTTKPVRKRFKDTAKSVRLQAECVAQLCRLTTELGLASYSQTVSWLMYNALESIESFLGREKTAEIFNIPPPTSTMLLSQDRTTGVELGSLNQPFGIHQQGQDPESNFPIKKYRKHPSGVPHPLWAMAKEIVMSGHGPGPEGNPCQSIPAQIACSVSRAAPERKTIWMLPMEGGAGHLQAIGDYDFSEAKRFAPLQLGSSVLQQPQSVQQPGLDSIEVKTVSQNSDGALKFELLNQP